MSVCSNCGKENQVHYKYCLGCGAELTGDAPPTRARTGTPAVGTPVERPDPRPVPRTVLAEPVEDDSVLGAIADTFDKVPDIGTNPAWKPNGEPLATQDFPEDSSVTEPTGATAEAAQARPGGRPCPTCGNTVPQDFAFCGQCGTKLETKPVPRTMFLGQQPVAQTGPHGRLVLVRPDGTEGGSHNLTEGENTIGRGHGALFDADGYLSPRHAELVLNAAGLVVRDTNSLNGVFVKLIEEEELVDGDVFRIGQELLRFDELRPPEPMEDGTEVLGSPNPGYWGRLAVIVGESQDGSAFPLFGDAVVLGRERGDLVFPEDGYVSGTHARVSFRNGRYYLCDMNSSNGTFLRIRGERLVPSGSFLLMGQQLFRVVYQ